MEQADTKLSNNNSKAQFSTYGYIVSDDADHALLDIANGLHAVAMLCEERDDDTPEIPKENWAGLLRTFARQAAVIHENASYTFQATASPRH